MKKTEGYSHAKADARKAKRRVEAEQRQAKHDALSTQEKIDLATQQGRLDRAMGRFGNSTREIAKLKSKLCAPKH